MRVRFSLQGQSSFYKINEYIVLKKFGEKKHLGNINAVI